MLGVVCAGDDADGAGADPFEFDDDDGELAEGEFFGGAA